VRPTEAQVLAAAAAIANAIGARRGVPPITNILYMLPPHLKDECMGDARAALEAALALEGE
jgi:hypothetical protein